MLIANLNEIPGRPHQVLGIVKGSIVQSKHIGRDIMAGLKTIVGGEISGYTEMLVEARQIATDRMIGEARMLRADAILGVRFECASIMQNAAELLAYGTAVKFE
ncbi:MAG: heavy metal-binding domain-containing protein [Holophagaceae bacterium]|nr:heavy metal-binding domain-containing protein [Holophagaceae bacterium]